MQVKIKKLHPDAIVPKYATPGAACFDLAALDEWCDSISIGDTATFRTGLSFEVPKDHVMLIFSRSGHGFKNDIRLANCVGVIDSDYRGEVAVKLTRDKFSGPTIQVQHSDRIAQALILPVEQVEFVEADELSDTERGTGGFGSTGN